MKKLTLALVLLGAISFTSCKKEEAASPSIKAKKVADTKETSSWD